MFTSTNQNLCSKMLVIGILFMLIFSTGCEGTAAPAAATNTSPPPATDTPPPSNTPEPTDTPQPTETPTPEPTDTPEPTSTSTPDLAATEAYEATQAAEAIVGEVQAELEKYGLPVDRGELVWFSADPITIKTDVYGQTLYQGLSDDLVTGDFILGVDVGWESTGGLAGCGIMFRSEENFEQGAHYRFYTIRLSGLPAWDFEYWKYNQWQATITGNIRTSSMINQDQGAVNSYVLYAEKDLLSVYGNGERLGRASNTKLTEGQIGFFTWQESGETTCTFENIWVWSLD